MRSPANPLSPADTSCSAATTSRFQLSANAEKSKLKRHTAWDGDMERITLHVKNAVVYIMSVPRTHKRLKSHDPSKNYPSKLSQILLSGVLYRKVSPQVEWKISGLWTGLTRERWCCTMGLMSRLDMNTCLTNIKTDILLEHC